jgi:hypothetical protein
MATVEQVAQLRLMVAEPDDTTYTDEMLGAVIDSYAEAALPLASSANNIWLQKAAVYAELVNISEGGSSRANGDLWKRAMDMAGIYQVQVDGAAAVGQRTRIARLAR